MPPFVTEFFDLMEKYGLERVLLVLALFVILYFARGWFTTRNKAASAKSDGVKADAEAVIKLAESVNLMAARIADALLSNNEAARDAAKERQETIQAIRDAAMRQEGFTLALGHNTQTLRTIASTVHEMSDHSATILTDLKEVRTTTAALPKLIKALDDRMSPVTQLLINLDNRISTILMQGQTDTQTQASILIEVGKIVKQCLALVDTLNDIKTLQYDQDERLAQHIQIATTLLNTNKETRQ